MIDQTNSPVVVAVTVASELVPATSDLENRNGRGVRCISGGRGR
jgi:hypothetical protein